MSAIPKFEEVSGGRAEPRTAFARLLLGTIESANGILCDTAEDVEAQTGRLSALFRSLTENTDSQTNRLGDLVGQIASVEHNGETIDLVSFPTILQQSLTEVTERILVLSKQGVSLIYSLDEIIGEIDEVNSCITEIEAINKQTRLLSLNAQIEAARAGSAGGGFQIVSTEMHELSRRIDALSERMRASITKVTESVQEVIGSIRTEYQELSEIGAMDLTSHIDAKEQLEVLLNALISRNESIQQTLGDSTETSRMIGDEIREVVVAMQFQDRMRQRSDAIVAAFGKVAEFMETCPDLVADEASCQSLTTTILDTITLSEVRQVFARNLGGAEAEQDRSSPPSPSIELF